MEWTDDDIDWSFERTETGSRWSRDDGWVEDYDLEGMPMTTHHKKHVVKVPEAAAELPQTHGDPLTPPDYQAEVLQKLDQIIVALDEILQHMRGQPQS